MEWFEEWFDSPLYDKLYANRDDAEAKVLADHLAKIMPADKFPNILDLGCGRGRHSINMALRNYHVTGMDLSQTAIKKARKKAEDQNLDIEFLIGDMREPLNTMFDGIINLFTSFGYFEKDEENSQVLQAMSKMLYPGGMIVIDYMNAINVITNYVPHERGVIDNIDFGITRFVENDTINKKMIFRTGGNSGEKVYSERVKLYTLGWFERNLAKAGIKIIQTFGDYELNDFNEQNSSRLIMIGKSN